MSLTAVEWFSGYEWYLVYKNLFSNDTTQKWAAVNRIKTWKSRARSNIPVAIEASLRLSECDLELDNLLSDGGRQILLGGTISQFVGLITEKGLKGSSFGGRKPIHVIGEEMGIPNWIVSLRHASVHGIMPNANILEKALRFSIEWVKENYWEAQAKHLPHLELKCENQSEAASIITVSKQYALSCLQESYPEVYGKTKVSKTIRMEEFKLLKSVLDSEQNGAEKFSNILLTYNIITYEVNSHIVKVNKQADSIPNFDSKFQRCWRLVFYYLQSSDQLVTLIKNILSEIEFYIETSFKKAEWYTAWISTIFTTMNRELSYLPLKTWSELLKMVSRQNSWSYKKLLLKEILKLMRHLCSKPQYEALLELYDIKYDESDDDIFISHSAPASRATSISEFNSSTGPWKICEKSLEGSAIGILPGQNPQTLQYLMCDTLSNIADITMDNGMDSMEVGDLEPATLDQIVPFSRTDSDWLNIAKEIELF